MVLKTSLIYSVGDIHGQYQKLQNLLRRCELDHVARGVEEKALVFVGDYVDRGPNSEQVVHLLMKLQAASPSRVFCLKGNHELILVAAARGQLSRYDVTLKEWLDRGGGAATLRSYGVTHPSQLPDEHVRWMDSLPLCYDDGHRFFCHAGINPELGLAHSTQDDLLLIREPFLSCVQDHGRLIVHGHTPAQSGYPELKTNRLNLDTGAGYGGPVSAAIFSVDQRGPIDFILE